MSSPSPALTAAHQLLKQLDCTQPVAIAPSDYAHLRDALLLVVQHSDYQILGICADSQTEAEAALRDYAAALGYSPDWSRLQGRSLPGAVYLKFNPKSGLCYADSYTGDYRGVLVSCQSAYDDGVNETYGHFPLDLFRRDST